MDQGQANEQTTNRSSSALLGAAILLGAAAPASSSAETSPLNTPMHDVAAPAAAPEVAQQQINFPAYFRPAVAVINLASATRQALKKFINDTSLPQTHMGLNHRSETKAIHVGPFLKVLNRVSNKLELVFEHGATPEPESLGIRSVAVHLQANLEVFSAHIRQLSEDGRLPYSDRDHACQSAIQLKAAVAQMILKVEGIMNGVGDLELENEGGGDDQGDQSQSE